MDPKEIQAKIDEAVAVALAKFKTDSDKEFQVKLDTARSEAKKEAGEENKLLTERLATVEEARKKERIDARLEKGVRAGKIAPKEKARLTAIFMGLPDKGQAVKYAKDDKSEAEQPMADVIWELFESRPTIFKELSQVDDPEKPVHSYDDPRAESDRRAHEHMKEHPEVKEYKQALLAVWRDDPKLADEYNRAPKNWPSPDGQGGTRTWQKRVAKV